MLTRELLSQSLPSLRLQDKVHEALQLMNDNHVTHLPITDSDKYIGIVSEEDLLQAENDNSTLEQLEQSFFNVSVKEDEHFLKAVQTAAENGLSVVPVISGENELAGTVAYNDLLRYASEFMSLNEPGGLIVLEIASNQYSFNELSKLVKQMMLDHTTQYFQRCETGMMQVTIGSISRKFQTSSPLSALV
jgi:predicted transcriptional regulator